MKTAFSTVREDHSITGTALNATRDNNAVQRFIQEIFMYFACTALVFALTVFVPSFIAMRDRTNANWRTR
ncbi:MAG TPA: hypothetical protein VGN16_15295 [Acidobacteriaceae bacterium]